MTDPWNIKKEDFPLSGSLNDKIRFVLGYAILAPSTHNSQPWLFKIEGNSCRIYYDPKLRLPEADPLGRDLYISMGCLIENLFIASSYFGILKDLKMKLEDELIVEFIFMDGNSINSNFECLLDTIPKRVNVRGIFEDKSVPEDVRAELLSLNKDGRLKINFITDKERIEKLASLTAEGLKMAHGRPVFRKEMHRWMKSSLTTEKEGLPGYSLRMPFILSFIIPVLVRFFDLSLLLAKLNYKSMVSVPFVCLITSVENSPSVWTDTGRLAERLMLHINSKGIKTSIFVASIEMGELYKKVQDILQTEMTPQFLFCAGYMSHRQKHSPRHSLEDKIVA